MRRIAIVVAAFLPCALLAMSPALPPVAGIAWIGEASAQTADINIIDNSVALTPTSLDYENDYVEATGNRGVRLNVRSTSPNGMAVYVRCGDAAPQIRLQDLLVRTLTPPGTRGTSMASYTPLAATNQLLWSTGVQQNGNRRVDLDLRVRNLFGYGDGLGAGTTQYSNTLTFTVFVP
jgi:hypothetical protein